MKKSILFILTFTIVLTLAGCKPESTTLLNACILDDTCDSYTINGKDNAGEVMFTVFKDKAEELGFDFDFKAFDMLVERANNEVQVTITSEESIQSFNDYDMNALYQVIKSVYDYTFDVNLPIDRVAFWLGTTDQNHLALFYQLRGSVLQVYNYYDEDYVDNVDYISTQLLNVMSEDTYTSYVLYYGYNNVSISLTYDPYTIEALLLDIKDCDGNDYCNPGGRLEIQTDILNVVKDQGLTVIPIS